MARFIIFVALLALATSHSPATAVVSELSPAKSKTSAGPHPSSPPLTNAAKQYLGAHNAARAAVGVAPLIWSQSLANATSRLARYQRNRKNCEFASVSAGKYGANQLWWKRKVVTPRLAVEKWVSEKQFYDYATNTCATNQKCGTYKQVVWRDTKEVGCAMATCSKEQTTLTICFYNPRGNFVGEKPY